MSVSSMKTLNPNSLIIILAILMLISFFITREAILEFERGRNGLNKVTGLNIFNIKTRLSNTDYGDKIIEEKNILISTYFCPRDKCIENIIKEIKGAEPKNITCFFYDENLKKLLSLLSNYNSKFYMDFNSFERKNSEKYFDEYTFVKFINLSSGLMHMKYCVFNNTIITGSYNPTERGNYYNNNNIVIIKSKFLAEIYRNKSRDIIEKRNSEEDDYSRFIIASKKYNNQTKNKSKSLIRTCFSPNEDCRKLIINEIYSADKSIYFLTFSFTDYAISNAIVKREKEVNADRQNKQNTTIGKQSMIVKGIVEQKFYSRLPDNIKEFVVNDSNQYNMHHKVFIIDNETVITGSYNPSYNARYDNMENLVIIKDKNTAEKFAKEFFYLLNFHRMDSRNKSNIKITAVMPNPIGNDKIGEYLIIKNSGSKTINLNYYFLNISNHIQRLEGTIKPDHSKRIKPKHYLKNKNGSVILFNETNTVENVEWNSSREGEIIKP